MGLLDQLYGVAWAIRPEALAALCEIAERGDVSPERVSAAMHFAKERREEAVARLEAVAAREGRHLDRTDTVTRRGQPGRQVAVLPVVGPIVRYASVFSSISGATSIESLAKDFTVAVEDGGVRAILLAVDSPGGEVAGVAELADMIHAARMVKPVWAYVSDLGASAGYWLASAADEIVVAETAALGSIGVVAAVRDPSKDKRGEIEFVSSVSPNKRADPTTESGRAQLQDLVDTLGEVFVNAVARNRGVDPETVTSQYGAGGLVIGRGAVTAGLADRLGSFEGTLDELDAHLADADAAEHEQPEAAPEPRRRAPAATTTEGGRSLSATLRAQFNRFLARLDPPDAATFAAALDGIEPPAIHEEPPAQEDQPMPQTPPITIPVSVEPVASEGDVPPAIAARLARLEAENRRLLTERIESAARAFAHEQIRDMRALPAQEATIVGLYMALAQDDDAFGAAVRADGTRIMRTDLLATFFATLPDSTTLGKEVLKAAGGQIALDRATAARPDPDAPGSPEELAALLNLTPTGRAVLSRAVTNGTGH